MKEFCFSYMQGGQDTGEKIPQFSRLFHSHKLTFLSSSKILNYFSKVIVTKTKIVITTFDKGRSTQQISHCRTLTTSELHNTVHAMSKYTVSL